MEPRERVKAVLNGNIPDRPPTRLRALPEVQQSLENYLGLKGEALFDRLGVDILDPIQTRAEGMVPEVLKEKFGNDLIFHGGVDEQELLPRATAEEVATEVRHLISTLGRKGGYILSSSHTLQPDTPPKNIVAMFDAVKEFSYAEKD